MKMTFNFDDNRFYCWLAKWMRCGDAAGECVAKVLYSSSSLIWSIGMMIFIFSRLSHSPRFFFLSRGRKKCSENDAQLWGGRASMNFFLFIVIKMILRMLNSGICWSTYLSWCLMQPSFCFLIYCLLSFDDMSGTDHSSAPSIGALHNNEERENVNFSFFFLVDFKQFFFAHVRGLFLVRSYRAGINNDFFSRTLLYIFIHDTAKEIFPTCSMCVCNSTRKYRCAVECEFTWNLIFSSAFCCFAILERENQNRVARITITP